MYLLRIGKSTSIIFFQIFFNGASLSKADFYACIPFFYFMALQDRYLSNIIRPAEVLTSIFDLDNVCLLIDNDSDED